MQEMCEKNLDIACAVDLMNFQRTKRGGLVSVGVANPQFDHLINQAATGQMTHLAVMYIVNKDQFNKIKHRPDRPITEPFLLSLGWKKDPSLNDRTFYFEQSKYTIEIGRDLVGGDETIIHDEYGFHDGLRYSGNTPTESQYHVLNKLLKIHE